MIKITVKVSSNGKLYLTGEYNVLAPKGKAIILGVKKHIDFIIEEKTSFSYTEFNQKEDFSFENGSLNFNNGNDVLVKLAISEAINYLQFLNIEIKPFSLKISSNLKSDEGVKYGLGSSAAIITGTIKSILTLHEVNFDEMLIFKLGVITKIKANEYSSGGDIAASLFEGLIYYRRYNKKWVLKNIDSPKLYKKRWPHLKIIKLNSSYEFGAIWTKESYKTVPLTYQITKKEYHQAKKIVEKTYDAIINKNFYDFKQRIIDYQAWLEKVLEKDNLVTDKLLKAIEIAKKHHLTSKISGAGGGDSVIVVVPKGYNKERFLEDLNKNDLEFLNI